jgi:hypothetical protein
MKTIDISVVAADPVISEVRRAKTALAQKYGFDVIAMVRALRQIDEEENANPKDRFNKTAVDNPLPYPSRIRRVAINLNLIRTGTPGSGLPSLDVAQK